MEETSTKMHDNGSDSWYDREKELMALDNTKAGVKGLIDAGVDNVPKIFIQQESEESSAQNVSHQIPIIDLKGIHSDDEHTEVVKEILYASKKWGFFQVINHGTPLEMLDNMVKGVKMFHEQDADAKKEYYTRDGTKPVVYNTNYDLYKSKAANWRDTITINNLYSGHLDPEVIPSVCRDAVLDYTSNIIKLAKILLELLSQALNLKQSNLSEMEFDKGWYCTGHYYPACPDPDLTLGSSKHTDPSLLTLVLQDHIGGLQVLHEDQWVDVKPIPGALVVNIGDILQAISNDKLKSVFHRVKANRVGTRISAAFFLTGLFTSTRMHGPIAELISEENPPAYREFTIGEFASSFFSLPLGKPVLDHFKITDQVKGDC